MASAVDRKKIEERAYQIFEERGRTPGFDFDDWLRAEKEVLNVDRSNKTSVRKKTF